MLSFLRNLLGRHRRASGAGEFHFPADLGDPRILTVVAGPGEGEIWPALYLLNSLGRCFPESGIEALICERDRDLLNILGRVPECRTYTLQGTPTSMSESGPGSIALTASSGRTASRLLESTGARVRVALDCMPGANLVVKLPGYSYPERVHKACEVLHMQPDRSWKPLLMKADLAKASSILAPVSGRFLPFIAAGTDSLQVLRKAGAEIPLRVITVEGRNCELLKQSAAVRAAVVSTASAVVADSPGLWAEACALGVPAVGLDPDGVFPPWGRTPAGSRTELLEHWSDLLRQGWQ
jgi:hypothetical protein